ncbi:condensin-2 complex subunit g2 [Anaeramoeba flamelloides]|uniref:Condensin-2 complex subunit g2 n=1 Tax=Anaeramoeba flamelloides TaxID=1746091 RepID=A0AAV7Y7X4_9EUKA|nr:condensin-2 complex subunit g2 [Anaeramoeba flamelloides]
MSSLRAQLQKSTKSIESFSNFLDKNRRKLDEILEVLPRKSENKLWESISQLITPHLERQSFLPNGQLEEGENIREIINCMIGSVQLLNLGLKIKKKKQTFPSAVLPLLQFFHEIIFQLNSEAIEANEEDQFETEFEPEQEQEIKKEIKEEIKEEKEEEKAENEEDKEKEKKEEEEEEKEKEKKKKTKKKKLTKKQKKILKRKRLFLQNEIVKLCEKWYLDGRNEKELLIPQTVCYLLLRSLDVQAKISEVKRVYNLRSGLKLLDFEDNSTEWLKTLLLRCVICPLYLKSNEGQKFISFLFQLDLNLIEDLHATIKNQIPHSRKLVLQTYAEIYFRAWKDSVGETLTKIEFNCIQDLMNCAIHASTPKVAKNLKLFLETIHNKKKFKGVDEMLLRLYNPILWRSLSVHNPLVRKNAAVLFIDAFPLQDSEAKVAENDNTLQKQFDQLGDLLFDPCVSVRIIAVKGVCYILGVFWEVIPSLIIKAFLGKLLNELIYDGASCSVRIAVIKGIIYLLDNRLSQPILKQVLPAIAPVIHDKIPRVRLTFTDLLLHIKKLKFIKAQDIVPLDNLLYRLSIDNDLLDPFAIARKYSLKMDNPKNKSAVREISENQRKISSKIGEKITRILLKTFFPIEEESSTILVSRAITLLKANPKAARVFYSYLTKIVRIEPICKLIVSLFKFVIKRLDGNTENEFVEKTVEEIQNEENEDKDEEENEDEDEAEDEEDEEDDDDDEMENEKGRKRKHGSVEKKNKTKKDKEKETKKKNKKKKNKKKREKKREKEKENKFLLPRDKKGVNHLEEMKIPIESAILDLIAILWDGISAELNSKDQKKLKKLMLRVFQNPRFKEISKKFNSSLTHSAVMRISSHLTPNQITKECTKKLKKIPKQLLKIRLNKNENNNEKEDKNKKKKRKKKKKSKKKKEESKEILDERVGECFYFGPIIDFLCVTKRATEIIEIILEWLNLPLEKCSNMHNNEDDDDDDDDEDEDDNENLIYSIYLELALKFLDHILINKKDRLIVFDEVQIAEIAATLMKYNALMTIRLRTSETKNSKIISNELLLNLLKVQGKVFIHLLGELHFTDEDEDEDEDDDEDDDDNNDNENDENGEEKKEEMRNENKQVEEHETPNVFKNIIEWTFGGVFVILIDEENINGNQKEFASQLFDVLFMFCVECITLGIIDSKLKNYLITQIIYMLENLTNEKCLLSYYPHCCKACYQLAVKQTEPPTTINDPTKDLLIALLSTQIDDEEFLQIMITNLISEIITLHTKRNRQKYIFDILINFVLSQIYTPQSELLNTDQDNENENENDNEDDDDKQKENGNKNKTPIKWDSDLWKNFDSLELEPKIIMTILTRNIRMIDSLILRTIYPQLLEMIQQFDPEITWKIIQLISMIYGNELEKKSLFILKFTEKRKRKRVEHQPKKRFWKPSKQMVQVFEDLSLSLPKEKNINQTSIEIVPDPEFEDFRIMIKKSFK